MTESNRPRPVPGPARPGSGGGPAPVPPRMRALEPQTDDASQDDASQDDASQDDASQDDASQDDAAPFADLDQRPVAEHVAVFDAEHARLQRELGAIDQI